MDDTTVKLALVKTEPAIAMFDLASALQANADKIAQASEWRKVVLVEWNAAAAERSACFVEIGCLQNEQRKLIDAAVNAGWSKKKIDDVINLDDQQRILDVATDD